jgi:2-oxoacid:acceptor oxidoreductase delta subunit (pyruvate/2-ketoisovalerate family)
MVAAAAGRGRQPAASGSADRAELFETEACWSDANEGMLCLHTGDWRTERPVFDNEKCNACGFCYIYCPPQCIVDHEDGIHYKADLEYCKGCGVCARECPKGAITMAPEGDYADDCHVG